jgi:hypothetical protein
MKFGLTHAQYLSCVLFGVLLRRRCYLVIGWVEDLPARAVLYSSECTRSGFPVNLNQGIKPGLEHSRRIHSRLLLRHWEVQSYGGYDCVFLEHWVPRSPCRACAGSL